MFAWLVVAAYPLALLLIIVGIACVSYVVIVPVNHFRYVRSVLTQRKRKLTPGINWIWPYEESVRIAVPTGNALLYVHTEFISNEFRYDPQPFDALTADQVTVHVDLSVVYTIDLDKAGDNPVAYGTLLHDQLRAATMHEAGAMERAKISALSLSRAFAGHTWTLMASDMRIKEVIVQNVTFDRETQALLRSKSLGLSPEDMVAYTQASNIGRNNVLLTAAGHRAGK